MEEDTGGWDAIREAWRSAVAHDLRGPVVTIDLAARLLVDDPALASSAEARGLVGRILRAVGRLDRMVQDLATAMAMDMQQVRLDKRPVDPVSVIEEAAAALDVPEDRPLALRVDSDVSAVLADPELLGRAVEHLVLNAIKYGHPESVVDVTLERAGEHVIVSVANEGQGIPPEEMPRIFDRFFRGEGGARMDAEGLGLGLYVARGLVEAHGGQLWAESTPGARTVFRFSVPAAPRRAWRPVPEAP